MNDGLMCQMCDAIDSTSSRCEVTVVFAWAVGKSFSNGTPYISVLSGSWVRSAPIQCFRTPSTKTNILCGFLGGSNSSSDYLDTLPSNGRRVPYCCHDRLWCITFHCWAFGCSVSKLCRRNLVESLQWDSKHRPKNCSHTELQTDEDISWAMVSLRTRRKNL